MWTVHPGLIHIVRGSVWVEHSISHEIGHVMQHLTLLDHDTTDWPYNSFSEPMADAHAAGVHRKAMRISNFYEADAGSMDYNGYFDSVLGGAKQYAMPFFPDPATAEASLGCGGGGVDPECCNHPTTVERGDCAIAHSDQADQQIFFDLLDGISAVAPEPVTTFYLQGGGSVAVPGFDDFDGGLNGAFHVLMDAVVYYLGRGSFANQAYVDRGRSRLDLVDVLDGMRCRGHLTQANSEELLLDAMGFDYDYLGPSSCP
jgi:hypothetical protein